MVKLTRLTISDTIFFQKEEYNKEKFKMVDKLIEDIRNSDYEGMYVYLKNNNLTLDEMMVELSKNFNLVNESLCYYIVDKNDIELAKKVADGIDGLEKIRVLQFKNAVLNGNYEEFLAQIDWRTKVNLCVKIDGLFDDGYSELKKYRPLIEKSAAEDMKNQELRDIVKEIKAKGKRAKMVMYPEEVGMLVH